jgi:hypothetical protein
MIIVYANNYKAVMAGMERRKRIQEHMQVAECLSSKQEVLGFNPQNCKNRTKQTYTWVDHTSPFAMDHLPWV